MGLKLSLTTGTGKDTMVNVVTAPDTAVGAVAEQLFRSDPARGGLPVPQEPTLVVTPRSFGREAAARSVDRDTDLASSGIRSGDHVAIVPAANAFVAAAASAVATVTVVEGADAGRSFPLQAGSHVIGRDADVSVQLSDPLASKRHARIIVGDSIEVVDMGSTNGVMLGDAFVTRATLIPGDRIVIGDTALEITRVAAAVEQSVPTTPTVPFTRSPKVVPPLPSEQVELPQPPGMPKPRRFPGISLVAPILLGTVMFLVTHRVISLLFIAMAPMMMMGNWWDSRRVQRKELGEKSIEFDEALAVAHKEIDGLHDREREIRFERSPSLVDLQQAAAQLSNLLWTRRPEHDGFLQVRVGIGDAPSLIEIEVPSRGESYPGFWERLLEARDTARLVKDVPIVADLRSTGNLGISGEAGLGQAVARGVVAQIACLHSPLEVVVAALVSPSSAGNWKWLWWLPHTSSPVSPIGVDHLADSRAGSSRLLTALEEIVAQRSGADIGNVVPLPRNLESNDPPEAPKLPAVIVVVEDDAVADRNRLIRLAEKGPDVNVHIVWVASRASQVPAACRSFVDASDAGSGLVGHVRRGGFDAPVSLEPLTVDEATDIARRLACIEDVGIVVNDSADVPPAVSYLELHGFDSLEPGHHEQRWRRDVAAAPGSKRPFSLRALVGHSGDAPFYLDLKTQGPHALVGGTTGAGKSEFLQSWILAMAAAYGPDRVTFLFVDYKGGSAFAECVQLPHSVGLVTDLTPQLVDRALTSLRAELHYRERLLSAKGAKDLETLDKTGDPETPPSLVIVIDEFAALVQEVPDFVDGVVDIAQRGRSLGLHLIMATQRPAGVIKDNLRANTNMRIALRMADEADSTDILGVRDAAHVDPSLPGRALARTGPGRVSTFQASYAGAHSTPDAGPPPITVHEQGMGMIAAWTVPETDRVVREEGEPDAARVVQAMRQAMNLVDIPAPRRPWLDELAPAYDLRELVKAGGQGIVFGVMDEPQRQAQGPAIFEPDTDGNMVFYGASGSGKSAALRTVAIAATLTRDIAPVHIYGVDAGSGGLEILQPMPNVGDIVHMDDVERVTRMMRTLASLVDERASRYSAARASSLTEYRTIAEARGEARVFLLIDAYGAFQNEYMNELGRAAAFRDFQAVLSEGRAVGVHVVMSADRPGALHSGIQAQVSRVIALRLVDDNQYSFLGLKRMSLPADAPAGRALDPSKGRELQVAILGKASAVAEQARHIETLAAQMPDRDEWKASPVPRMPSAVDGATLPDEIDGNPVLGIEEASLAPVGVNLDRALMIAGQGGSGRSTTLAWLSESIKRAYPLQRQVLLTLRRSNLPQRETWHATATSVAAIAELLDKMSGDISLQADGDSRIVLMIEGVNDFNGTSVDMQLTTALKELKRNGHVVVGEAETTGWTSGMVLNEIKSVRRGLLLQPEQQDGSLLMGVAMPRMNRAAMPPGRAAFVENGRFSMVQIPMPHGEFSPDSGAGPWRN